jgi:flagellin-specific chaperone FliS
MNSYQEHALDGASAVDLVVALYDGILRFLYAAVEAVDRGDETGRRIAVKRAMDIIIHLQARLRMDVGGRPRAGSQRVLRLDFRADAASLAVGLAAEVRARD